MTSIICITCPKGCRLSVDEENGYKVTGNGCPRGEIYGKNELQHPVRVITSTVRIEDAAVPAGQDRQAAAEGEDVRMHAPARRHHREKSGQDRRPARRAYPRHGRQYRRDKGVVKRHFSGR